MDYHQEFLDYLKLEKNFSDHTTRAYSRDLKQFRNFLLEEFDGIPPVKANYSLIRSWIVHMVENKISNQTVNRKISSLRAYYRFLQKTELLDTSPLQHHSSLKTKQNKQLPFSEKEMTDVLQLLEGDFFKTHRERAIINLMYSTGMRRAELINITEDQIDWGRKQIKIIGKRNKERIIPLRKEMIEILEKWLRDKEEILNSSSKNRLFVTDKGAPLYPKWVYRLVNRFFSRASSKLKCSPHIIRHSFATHLLNRGADLNAIKELLGHESLNSTQIYASYNMTELKRVYEKSHPRNK